MPSSHSALMVGATYGAGLFVGFDSAVFAVVFAMSMIVVYDATGVRRQAGFHAEKINILLSEFFSGGDLSTEKKLREVLGHTPLEAIFRNFARGGSARNFVVPGKQRQRIRKF